MYIVPMAVCYLNIDPVTRIKLSPIIRYMYDIKSLLTRYMKNTQAVKKSTNKSSAATCEKKK